MKEQTSATTETLNKGKTMIDFTGKTIYAGIDVHKIDWQVGLFYSGLVLGNHRMAANIGDLINLFNKQYSGAVIKCVYDTTMFNWKYVVGDQKKKKKI